MPRTASIFCIALGITAIIVASIVWLAPLAGEVVMTHIRQHPDGPLWVRVLTPLLPVFLFAVFGLVTAARRPKGVKPAPNAAAQ